MSCQEWGRDPLRGPVASILNFLAELFEQGFWYCSLNPNRSAISSVHGTSFFKINFVIPEDGCFVLCKFYVDPSTDGGDPLDQKSTADRQIDGETAFQLYIVDQRNCLLNKLERNVAYLIPSKMKYRHNVYRCAHA